MKNQKINIEIFCAPNCSRCSRTVSLVEQVLNEIDNDLIQCHKLNVVDEIDYAVSLGVRATPAIAFNGKLEFTSTPDIRALLKKINKLM